jgi:2-keto-4-pentenoate hydratase/2-oxohepta-3-ene-1,7-dioic acid hydratase in catechol pathway
MKLANLLVEGEVHLGSITSGGILDITEAAASVNEPGCPRSLDEALASWSSSLASLLRFERRFAERPDFERFLLSPSRARLLPPVSAPSKILCVYVNYRTHSQEVGSAPSEPIFFFKHSKCIVGDGDDVVVPRFSQKPDHEVELGVIIGKRGKDIQPPDAYEHVAGYTVVNDISFRDGMMRGVEGTPLGRNLFRGKVADTSLPIGPCMATRDEISSPYPLRLALRVNGQQRQEGTTDDMIFKVPELIASASEGNTLLPGDVISTGTCSGVGLHTGMYLKEGDIVEAEVEKIGVLKTVIRKQ